jgi:hypothetical protein
MDAKTIAVEGEVRHEVVAPGSKSERKAVVLTTPSGKKYVLQREEGNPFADPTLDKLVGHSVKAEGLATSGILTMRNWKTTD